MATLDKPIVSFAKLTSGMDLPNLLDVQLRAFETLLQTDAAAREREDVGLERVFNEIFPISDVNGNFSLEFVRYSLGEPKYDMEECMERDMTYAAPLKATLRLVVWEDLGDERRPKDIIEKEVYLGDLPVLTPLGTFIINGAERVIVSQLHRSPGVVFEENTHPNGSKLFSARIIPFRGSWVEFTVDIHDVVYVHIDRKKKFPATALLRAFGYGSDEDILRLFYTTRELDLTALPPREAMVRLIDFSLDYLNEHREFIRMIADENAHEARHVQTSEMALRTNSPLLDLIAETLDRGVAQGSFRDGVDPLELYISIAGMTFFYFANGLTMSAIFGRDLSRRDAVASYRDHIVTLILAGLRP